MLRKIALLAVTLLVPSIACAQTGQSIAGWDYVNGRSKVPNVNSAGAMAVFGAAAGGSVFGTDANNASPSVAPVNVSCINGGTGPNTAGRVTYLFCDSNGRLTVNINGPVAVTLSGSPTVVDTQPTAANLNAQVVGTVANGVADTGNSIKTGCIGNTAAPTAVSAGQRVDCEADTSGNQRVIAMASMSAGADAVSNTTIASFTQATSYATTAGLRTFSWMFNGTTWDRPRTIQDSTNVPPGLGVPAVALAPTSAVAQAIVPVLSASLESGHIFKGSAGNLYRVRATVNIAGYVLGFNSTTVPADGAVTPASCTQVSAGTTEIDHAQTPDRYSVGISFAFSTTGCFTKTASVNAMFEGYVQ